VGAFFDGGTRGVDIIDQQHRPALYGLRLSHVKSTANILVSLCAIEAHLRCGMTLSRQDFRLTRNMHTLAQIPRQGQGLIKLALPQAATV
jgi:hypothetical protein